MRIQSRLTLAVTGVASGAAAAGVALVLLVAGPAPGAGRWVLLGGLLLASGLVAVRVARAIGRSITRPLTRLAQGTETAGSANRAAALREVGGRSDEIGELARAIQRMSAGLERELDELARADEALRASEGKLHLFAEHSLQGMAIAGGSPPRPLFANQALADILGCTREELLAFSAEEFGSFIHEEDRGLFARRYRDRMAGKAVPQRYELRFVRRTGELRWVELFATRVEYEGAPAVQAAFVDITQRKLLEEQLRQSQKMEAVGRLAGGVAHDFNNLLTAITGYGSLALGRTAPGDPRHGDLEQVLKAGERAAALTEQLLMFSRRHVYRPTVLDLTAVVTELEKMLRRLIGEDIELVTRLLSDAGRIKADPTNMEQVVMNLAVNARDAMPDGGKLTITTEEVRVSAGSRSHGLEARPGRFVRLSVEDTGAGMEPEVLGHIFEPFYTTRKEGTGLGLSVVYGIVAQHEGWIHVQSESGRGARFDVYFPVLHAPDDGDREAARGLNDLRGRGERILLVEDDAVVRSFAGRLLAGYGYEVREAASAGDATRLFDDETGRFDLLFSDVVLPDGTGVQLAERLLEQNGGLRVLLSSGYTDDKSQWSRIREQGFHFRQKPYRAEEILESIRAALGGTDA